MAVMAAGVIAPRRAARPFGTRTVGNGQRIRVGAKPHHDARAIAADFGGNAVGGKAFNAVDAPLAKLGFDNIGRAGRIHPDFRMAVKVMTKRRHLGKIVRLESGKGGHEYLRRGLTDAV